MFRLLKNKIFGGDSSGKTAKSRLHFVLVQDRSGLTNDEMTSFRQDLINVLKKYFVIDNSGVEVSYQRDKRYTTLTINSPVLRKKERAPKQQKSIDATAVRNL